MRLANIKRVRQAVFPHRTLRTYALARASRPNFSSFRSNLGGGKKTVDCGPRHAALCSQLSSGSAAIICSPQRASGRNLGARAHKGKKNQKTIQFLKLALYREYLTFSDPDSIIYGTAIDDLFLFLSHFSIVNSAAFFGLYLQNKAFKANDAR